MAAPVPPGASQLPPMAPDEPEVEPSEGFRWGLGLFPIAKWTQLRNPGKLDMYNKEARSMFSILFTRSYNWVWYSDFDA